MYAVVIKGSRSHKELTQDTTKRFSPGYSTKIEADKVISKSKSPERLVAIRRV